MGDFPDEVIATAWIGCNGFCECTRVGHGHGARCARSIELDQRGREGPGAWEAHHRTAVESGGGDELSNCEILCWPCHSKTF